MTPSIDKLLFTAASNFVEVADRRAFLEFACRGDQARLRQLEPFGIGPLAIERVRHLDQDARTIAQQRVCADRAAMIQVFQNLQRLRDDRVTFGAFDMGHKAHTTSIVFLCGVIQTRLLQR